MFMAVGVVLSGFRIGFAKEKERALQAERERTKRLKLMLDISTTVTSSLKIDQVLQILAARVVETVGATFCRVALLDGSGEYLRVVASHPVRDMEMAPSAEMTIVLAEMPEYRKAIETRSAVIIGDRRHNAQESIPRSEGDQRRSAK